MKPMTRRTAIGSAVTEMARDPSLARRGPQQRGQEADGRALAGAVGPDEAEDLPLADREAQVVDGDEIAVALGEVDHLDHWSRFSLGSFGSTRRSFPGLPARTGLLGLHRAVGRLGPRGRHHPPDPAPASHHRVDRGRRRQRLLRSEGQDVVMWAVRARRRAAPEVHEHRREPAPPVRRRLDHLAGHRLGDQATSRISPVVLVPVLPGRPDRAQDGVEVRSRSRLDLLRELAPTRLADLDRCPRGDRPQVSLLPGVPIGP